MTKNTPKKEAPEPTPTQAVMLLNFGDSARVVYKPNGKPVQVDIGAIVSTDLSERAIERIKARDKTLIVLPPDIAEKAAGPFMQNVLEALRDFNDLTYERALYICMCTLGEGAFESQRPTKTELRLALARRAKDAAHYIIAGAYETADKLLGEGREVPEFKPAIDGVGLVTGDVVQGDPDTEDQDGNDTRFFQRPAGYVEPETGGDGAAAEGDAQGDTQKPDADDGQAGAGQPAGGDDQSGEDSHGSAGANGDGEASHAERRQRSVTGKPGRPQRPVTGE